MIATGLAQMSSFRGGARKSWEVGSGSAQLPVGAHLPWLICRISSERLADRVAGGALDDAEHGVLLRTRIPSASRQLVLGAERRTGLADAGRWPLGLVAGLDAASGFHCSGVRPDADP
jgi:hypothetical protein